MNILSFLRQTRPQDINSVFVLASQNDQQTYGLTWDNLVAGIQEAIGTDFVAGFDTQIQYNASDAFAADNNFRWDYTGQVLTVVGAVVANSYNGVVLENTGASTEYLSRDGSYSVPASVAPGGSNTHVQFNNSGSFDGSSLLTWDGATLAVTGAVTGNTFNGVALTTGGGGSLFLADDGAYKTPSISWGSITGTLSSQTDLQNALNAKLNLSGGTLTGALTGTTISATTFSGALTGNVTGNLTGNVTGDVNGVTINNGGAATSYLDETGNYSVPTGAANSWGSITGTLSNQTDLQNALNAKLSLSGGAMTGAVTSTSTWTGTSFNGVVLTTGGSVVNVLRENGTYAQVDFSEITLTGFDAAVAGTPAVTANTAKVFGTEYGFDQSIGDTVNSTPVLVSKCTYTIPSGAPTGVYFATYTAQFEVNTNNRLFTTNLQVNTVEIDGSPLSPINNGDDLTETRNFRINHTNGVASVVDFLFANGGAGVITCSEATLQVWRIS